MTKSMVSVIIPVYNREEFVEECIQSVVSQTYQNFEIVLIDDGSTDKTLKICKRIAESDLRIKVLQTAHGGVSAARNIGLDNAQGEYVFFLDSDDVIHPQLFETFVTALQKSNAVIAATEVLSINAENWDNAKLNILQSDDVPKTEYKNDKEVLHSALAPKESPLNMLGGVMMRRDFIGDTRFSTNFHIGEDFYFIYQNIIKDADAVFLKQKWYYARNHKNNSSWDWSFNGFLTRFRRREAVWKSEEKFGRNEYANYQKQNAVSIFLSFVLKFSFDSEESKKLHNFIKSYRKELYPALDFKGKIRWCIAFYMPSVYIKLSKVEKKLKKR